MKDQECKICDTLFETHRKLMYHLISHNITSKQYYDKFLKTQQDGTCITCGKETSWSPNDGRYCLYCSNKCNNTSDIKKEKCKHTNLIKRGVEYYSQTEEYNIKIKKTCQERYNVDHMLNINAVQQKIKETNKKKYGCERVLDNKIIKEKRDKTMLSKFGGLSPFSDKNVRKLASKTIYKRYGTKNAFSNKQIQQKCKQTMMDRYGCENPSQNKEMLERAQISAYHSKVYVLPSGTVIYKQGYEPQFLNYVFKNNILKENDIVYHPNSIKYINYKYKNSYYHPDFYIPKWNLIVEIKSSWTEQNDKNILLKEQACIRDGFKYIRLVNNNFKPFDDFIKSLL